MKESLTLSIYKDLYEKIKSRYYKTNQQIPTETELAESYRVSKAPVRQALGKLEHDGLVLRKAGKGTFVSPVIRKDQFNYLGGFGTSFAKYEKQIHCELVELKEVMPKESVVKNLRLKDSRQVVLISRIRFVNKKPVFFLNHYVPTLPLETFRTEKTIENMRGFLQRQGVEMAHVTEKIRAVVADVYLSHHFKINEGAPLLKIFRTTFNRDYQPVVYEEYYVLSEEWPYEVQFDANEEENGV